MSYFNRNNLFGSAGQDQGHPPPRDAYGQPPPNQRAGPGGYGSPQRGQNDYDHPMNGGHDTQRQHTPNAYSNSPLPTRKPAPRQNMPQASPGRGGGRPAGPMLQLQPAKSPDNTYTFRNLCVSLFESKEMQD